MNRLNDIAVKHIEDILKRGSDALVQMRRDGAVVVEQKKRVVYRSSGQPPDGKQIGFAVECNKTE